jgi:hypothetical protein
MPRVLFLVAQTGAATAWGKGWRGSWQGCRVSSPSPVAQLPGTGAPCSEIAHGISPISKRRKRSCKTPGRPSSSDVGRAASLPPGDGLTYLNDTPEGRLIRVRDRAVPLAETACEFPFGEPISGCENVRAAGESFSRQGPNVLRLALSPQ